MRILPSSVYRPQQEMDDTSRFGLRWPFHVLKTTPFSLSPLKLEKCNGGTGRGIKFSQSSVQSDYIYQTESDGEKYGDVYTFTEIFLKGNVILMDYIELGKVPTSKSREVLETLLSFVKHIKDAEKALDPEDVQFLSEEKDGKRETEWSARLAVHFLSPFSLTRNYILDKHNSRQYKECPCRSSCKSVLQYGDTSIGHPKTWYGCFDILITNSGNAKKELLGAKDEGRENEEAEGKEEDDEGAVGVTEVPEEADDESDTSSLQDDENSFDESSSQTESKINGLHSCLSQLISQTIVSSFCQRKCSSSLSFVPSIAVNKSHIQFHFYDCERDIYLLSREMPLFYDADDNKALNLTTVIATWLVLNYNHLSSGATKKMSQGEKFGFHSKTSQKILHLYRNNIEMGLTNFKPHTFHDNILLKRFRLHNDDTSVVDAKYPKTRRD